MSGSDHNSSELGLLSLNLREQHWSARLGISFLLLTLIAGFVFSGLHLVKHHENRDEKPGLSMDDIVGAYHGLDSKATMLTALEAGHPSEQKNVVFSEQDKNLLLSWLNGDRVSSDFDNLDLGDSAPSEIIAKSCLECHSRGAELGDGIGNTVPLEYWDDVGKVVFSRHVEPTDTAIKLASSHTHFLSLGLLLLVISILALSTALPKPLINLLIFCAGFGLIIDLASWWITPQYVAFAWLIMVGGVLFVISSNLMLACILIDMWILPDRRIMSD